MSIVGYWIIGYKLLDIVKYYVRLLVVWTELIYYFDVLRYKLFVETKPMYVRFLSSSCNTFVFMKHVMDMLYCIITLEKVFCLKMKLWIYSQDSNCKLRICLSVTTLVHLVHLRWSPMGHKICLIHTQTYYSWWGLKVSYLDPIVVQRYGKKKILIGS